MSNLVFQSGSTWRKLGFALYSNSLSYREVLENNPAWSVFSNPPEGTVLSSGPSSGSLLTAGLSQNSPMVSQPLSVYSEDYYPFTTPEDYVVSLSRYAPNHLKNVERLNGWISNSITADTGVQPDII